ncbi:hypothetical protein [Tengunoibacter tsumagoiensis]|uniref:Uncharacterized protein n=1 Tax=Tengunoibacter tsumagoiensis TaxID=2014871 RepID=A0A401ZZ35_9CHLR|nr:hypothetical protein [Tengunoibacter tsumagoiensis]GCE12116.1 hypothetical protein KTT_19750 [Tengunoibacter tsumagoiensis]
MMHCIGYIKFGNTYPIKMKNGGQKEMVSFTVVDGFGTNYSFQMWPDDPQHAEVAAIIKDARRQPVQVDVASHVARLRKFQDGSEKPQTNFTATNVQFLSGSITPRVWCSGTVQYGGAYEVGGKDRSKKIMLSFSVADEIANSYAFQMWPDDPQHSWLAPLIAQARRQPIEVDVASYVARLRKFKDGTEKPQTNFVATNVVFPGLSQSEQSA